MSQENHTRNPLPGGAKARPLPRQKSSRARSKNSQTPSATRTRPTGESTPSRPPPSRPPSGQRTPFPTCRLISVTWAYTLRKSMRWSGPSVRAMSWMFPSPSWASPKKSGPLGRSGLRRARIRISGRARQALAWAGASGYRSGDSGTEGEAMKLQTRRRAPRTRKGTRIADTAREIRRIPAGISTRFTMTTRRRGRAVSRASSPTGCYRWAFWGISLRTPSARALIKNSKSAFRAW